jgi:hypothetical protein
MNGYRRFWSEYWKLQRWTLAAFAMLELTFGQFRTHSGGILELAFGILRSLLTASS